MLTVNQGYNSDGTGIPTFTVGAGEPGDLSVGVSYIDAAVEHRGSSASELYDWNVSFTITNTTLFQHLDESPLVLVGSE